MSPTPLKRAPAPLMSPRSVFHPLQPATQGVGGSQNSGIFIVKHLFTQRTYIEKRIPPAYIQAGDTQREIRSMQQSSSHPNIVSIVSYDLNYTSLKYGSVYMQHCELGSLDALIMQFHQRKTWLPDEGFLWKVFWDISLALCYLWTGHDNISVRIRAAAGKSATRVRGWNAIIHRDLKPSNIFLTWTDPLGADATSGYPTCLIGDFGCSVTSADVSAGNGGVDVLPGQDREFEPPEAPAYSEQGDVYGVGLILHCLALMQQAPIKSRTAREQVPFQNMRVSEGLDMLACNCLMRDPEMRPSPQDLPMLVWRGYQAWRMGRKDNGRPLPDWAFGSK